MANQRCLVVDGAAYKDSDLISRDWLMHSQAFRDVCATLDIGHMGIGVVFAGTDGRQLPVVLSLYRSPRDLPFDDDEIDLLRRLLPHLSRSLGVMFHLHDKEQQVASSRAALDRLVSGMVLLDGQGGVQFANAAAERLLRRGDHVCRVPRASKGLPRADRLAGASTSRAVRATFTRAVAAATRPYDDADDDGFFEAQLLPDSDGRPALVMQAAPIGTAPPFAAGGMPARAIVFFQDLNGPVAVDPKQLCNLFGIMPAESLAAMRLLESGSMQEMPGRLGVSVNTLKTQVKAVYAKTHPHRRANLLRLMLSLCVSQAQLRTSWRCRPWPSIIRASTAAGPYNLPLLARRLLRFFVPS